jgi:hypothetical protein
MSNSDSLGNSAGDNLTEQQWYVPQNGASGTVTTKTGTSVWSWVLLVVATLIVIGFVIWYIFWTTKTNNNSGIYPSALNITGTKIVVLSDTSIRATWTSVGDAADKVILYVNPTGSTMKFDSSGKPLSNYKSSPVVTSPTTNATVTGLVSGGTYDAVLVVTNPNYPNNANTSHHQSGLVLVSRGSVPNRFSISASGQGGQIRYSSSSTPTNPITGPNQVFYTLNDSTVPGTLFHQDSDGYICATTQNKPLLPTDLCTDNSYVLYSTSSNQLGIAQMQQLKDSGIPLSNAKWQYNAGGQNEWCLIGTGTNRCMTYDLKNSPQVTSTTSTTPPITNQVITVSNQGTSWTNQAYN